MVLTLDKDLIDDLRHSINSTINTALVKQHCSHRTKGTIYSWNQICALMDRIQDIVWYLDELVFHYDNRRMLVFDFYAFMTQADVLDDCISTLAHIYNVDLTIENSQSTIFNEKGMNGKGSDKNYFDYLRSLCVIHPGLTNRFQGMYTDENGQCCPHVLINNHFINIDGDLIVRVYYNDEEHTDDYIGIHLEQVFQYVRERYLIINKIIDGVHQYNDLVELKWMKIHILDATEFPDYIDYLNDLRREKTMRFPASEDYELERVIRLLTTTITNKENEPRYQKYCNAIKYAVSFEHIRIQKMGRGEEKEMGIINTPRESGFTILDHILDPRSNSEGYRKHAYEISKLDYLIDPDSPFNAQYAHDMILNNIDFFGKYVKITRNMSYEEVYTLTLVGLYFDCLNSSCVLNDVIPKTKDYRDF